MKPQLLLRSLYPSRGERHGNLLFQYNVVSTIKTCVESVLRENAGALGSASWKGERRLVKTSWKFLKIKSHIRIKT